MPTPPKPNTKTLILTKENIPLVSEESGQSIEDLEKFLETMEFMGRKPLVRYPIPREE